MKKTIGLILLDPNDIYVYNDGSLPIRPAWDKELLRSFADGEFVSIEAAKMLPPSIRKVVDVDYEPTFPVTIREIAKSDILLVTRSPAGMGSGKRFRFNNFTLIVSFPFFEIWRKKT
jgi:hypothetical protein